MTKEDILVYGRSCIYELMVIFLKCAGYFKFFFFPSDMNATKGYVSGRQTGRPAVSFVSVNQLCNSLEMYLSIFDSIRSQ